MSSAHQEELGPIPLRAGPEWSTRFQSCDQGVVSEKQILSTYLIANLAALYNSPGSYSAKVQIGDCYAGAGTCAG